MIIRSRSDLGYRLTQSFSRNESKFYRPEVVWTADKNNWPGDWEGRTILALVSLAKATGKEPSYLEGILDLLPYKLNANGYMGEIYPNGAISEQQLAGNSWMLRGLIEYTTWKKTNKLLPIIERMVKNLYVPVIAELDNYFVDEYEKDGTYSGTIIASRGKWLLSTDTGCAFISTDGISQAYELLGWEELKTYVLKMREKFITADLYGGKFQTHASLSCSRGFLRMYNLTGERKLLDTAITTFNLYTSKGMTENYSNCNRFNVAVWTEPCCMVDSYMCCIELYKITKEPKYLDLAQKIYFNSLSHSQLPNGGMGLETCVGHHNSSALGYNRNKQTNKIYEAYWCCTMRGGDGFAYVSQNQCLKSNENTYTYVNFFDNTLFDDEIIIDEKTQYPACGKTIFSIFNPLEKTITLQLFVPLYAKTVILNGEKIAVKDHFVTFATAKQKCEITLEFDVPLLKVDCSVLLGYHKFMHGNVLLGTTENVDKVNNLTYVSEFEYVDSNGIKFDRVGNTIYKEMEEIDSADLRVLFLS